MTPRSCAKRTFVCHSRNHDRPDTGAVVWWDQADGAFGSAAVLRPAGSPLMPLRRTHRRPDPATWSECGGRGPRFRTPRTQHRGHPGGVRTAGARNSEYQRPSVAAGAARWGRFLERRGAQPEGRCAQRTSSSFWPRLSERRERSERSEFCGPTLGRAPQGSRRVQRPTVPV